MKIIDLTHTIEARMPVYPHTVPPRIEPALSLEQDGYRETSLNVWSHTGTHIDAPSHLLAAGASLDQLPIQQFFGLALKLEVSGFAGREIPLDFVQAFADKLKTCEFLVLHSGWEQKWGEDGYFHGYPTLSREAAEYLAGFSLQGLGLDMISADAPGRDDLPIHRALLSQGMIIVENLCGLDQVLGDLFLLCVLPLKYADADGSPIRAVGFQAPAGIYYPE